MIAELKLKMDRPIDKTQHYISPGGYEVKLNDGSCIQFDFMDSEGYVDEKDPTIITFILKHSDTDSFPDMNSLTSKYMDICELSECYVFTGEKDEPEINVAEILKFIITDEQTVEKTKYEKPRSTTIIEITDHYAKDNGDDTITHETTYAFTAAARDLALHNLNT